MPASTCFPTTSATAARTRTASATGSTGTPSSLANIMRMRSAGRGRLPVWVVRKRSVLRFIPPWYQTGGVGGMILRGSRPWRGGAWPIGFIRPIRSVGRAGRKLIRIVIRRRLGRRFGRRITRRLGRRLTRLLSLGGRGWRGGRVGRRRFGPALGHGHERGAQYPLADHVASLHHLGDRTVRQRGIGHLVHGLVQIGVELLAGRRELL